MRLQRSFGLSLLLLTLLGRMVYAQDVPPTTEATAFLKWSMSRYAALKTFRADCTWSESFPGTAPGSSSTTRTIAYEAPNRFKVTNTTYGRLVFNYICDGRRMVITTQGYGQPPQRFPAPASLADAPENNMSHPDFGGSALYRFFAGPDGVAKLLDEEDARRIQHRGPTPVSFGPDVTIGGEPCKTVIFGGGLYHDERRAVISVRDGLVRRLEYRSAKRTLSAEQIAQTKRALKQYLQSAPGGKLSADQRTRFLALLAHPTTTLPPATTTELYTGIVTDAPILDAEFDTTLPGGTTFAEVGRTVPDAVVKPLRGGPGVSLASLRGQIVLIDFWATWCPPCRKGLPETLALHTHYAGKGVRVLAVTDEETPVVAAFVTKNRYASLPVYRDPGGKLGRLFAVNAIPTVAVIDGSGKLIAQLVGLQTPATLEAALKQAGLQP